MVYTPGVGWSMPDTAPQWAKDEYKALANRIWNNEVKKATIASSRKWKNHYITK